MIEFRQKGDFSKLSKFLERVKEAARIGDLDKYGRAGVAALSSATPVDTGKTAASWTYEIKRQNGSVSILPILEKLTGMIVYGGQHNGQNLKITVFLRIRQRNLLRLRLL